VGLGIAGEIFPIDISRDNCNISRDNNGVQLK
jgi:hypothetical protein